MATLPKPTTPTDAEQAIRALAQEFVKHHNAREVDKIVRLFSRDGRMFAPFRPAAEGADALRQLFTDIFTEYDPHDLKVETTHIEVSGNIAYSFGTFAGNERIPTGKRLDTHGKWIATLRREGGTWLIVGHCFNTDMPINTLIAA